jgi:hypothetical protein
MYSVFGRDACIPYLDVTRFQHPTPTWSHGHFGSHQVQWQQPLGAEPGKRVVPGLQSSLHARVFLTPSCS